MVRPSKAGPRYPSVTVGQVDLPAHVKGAIQTVVVLAGCVVRVVVLKHWEHQKQLLAAVNSLGQNINKEPVILGKVQTRVQTSQVVYGGSLASR